MCDGDGRVSLYSSTTTTTTTSHSFSFTITIRFILIQEVTIDAAWIPPKQQYLDFHVWQNEILLWRNL
ncbi:hypothetical protein P8452_07113 [Trifolium repens]|nr:hypothetical protein P8452_07113 [Trifolium repens]